MPDFCIESKQVATGAIHMASFKWRQHGFNLEK